MNLKLEALKACIFVLIGAFLCNQFSPKPEAPKAEIKQEQSAKCKASIIKRENKDGSKDEIISFDSESAQKQEVKIESKPVKKNGLGLFKDQLIYKRKIFETNVLDFNALIKADKNKADIGVMIEW